MSNLITYDDKIDLIIDSATPDINKWTAANANQIKKAINSLGDVTDKGLIYLNENTMAIFAYDGTTKFYIGSYNRKYGYFDRVINRIFIDFDIQINALGDVAKAPDDARIMIQINGAPKYITNMVSPIAMYNINTASNYNQIGVQCTAVNGVTHLQLIKFSSGAYQSLTKADLKTGSSFNGGINYRTSE